jgi:hypothetical protein
MLQWLFCFIDQRQSMTFTVMTTKKLTFTFLLEIPQKVHDNFFCNSPHVWISMGRLTCVNMVANLFVGGVVLAKKDAFFTHFPNLPKG